MIKEEGNYTSKIMEYNSKKIIFKTGNFSRVEDDIIML